MLSLVRGCLWLSIGLLTIPSIAAQTVEVEIEDEIGSSAQHVDLLPGQTSFATTPQGDFIMPATVFTAPLDGVLAVFTANVMFFDSQTSGPASPADIEGLNFRVSFWSSPDSYFDGPNAPDFEASFADPTNADSDVVVGSYTNSMGQVFDKRNYEFDLTLLDLEVAAGQQYVLGVQSEDGLSAAAVMQISYADAEGLGEDVDVLAGFVTGVGQIGPVYLDDLGSPFTAFGTRVTFYPDIVVGDFVRGDANGDELLDVSDPVKILDVLFLGGAAGCEQALDANDDEAVNVGDPVFLLVGLFQQGPLPQEPFPSCGSDPTRGLLSCEDGVCP